MTRYLLLFDSYGLIFVGRPLSFVHAAGPCQRSLSRARVPWYSQPYFTVSDLRLPFSSPPTTRRVTLEVFDLASTRVKSVPIPVFSYILLARTTHRKHSPSIVALRRHHRKRVSRVRLRVHCSVRSTGHCADDIGNTASSIVACWTVFTELLPGNALIESVNNIYSVGQDIPTFKKQTCSVLC
jgi:hypothetical protein